METLFQGSSVFFGVLLGNVTKEYRDIHAGRYGKLGLLIYFVIVLLPLLAVFSALYYVMYTYDGSIPTISWLIACGLGIMAGSIFAWRVKRKFPVPHGTGFRIYRGITK